MKKIKIEKGDIFAGFYGLTIKGMSLTGSTIGYYDLYKMPRKSTYKKDYYKLSKDSRGFYIVHDKVKNTVDWFEHIG